MTHIGRCIVAFVSLLAACGGSETADELVAFDRPPVVEAAAAADAAKEADGAPAHADGPLQVTPVTMRIAASPVPVKGSDDRYHVVYELELVNFTGARVGIDRLEVLDAGSGSAVAALDAQALGQRLVVTDAAAQPASLGPAQFGLVYMHLVFERKADIPRKLHHRIAVTIGAASLAYTAGGTKLRPPTDLVLDAPLRGERYVAADGCCDAPRHVRATLPLNGRLFNAQRFAIDWEQLDEQRRIFVGDPKKPESYVIYNKPAYAVADARVVAALDGLPDSPPGGLPPDLPIEQADGNHVVLDLGDGRFALYAHFAPNSVQVRRGDRVRRGQLLGRVGTSGNSSEPHLHFHVMDGPSPLASNGLPHRLERFSATHRGVSTAAFDHAAATGEPLVVEPVPGAARRDRTLPLDLLIVDFPQ